MNPGLIVLGLLVAWLVLGLVVAWIFGRIVRWGN